LEPAEFQQSASWPANCSHGSMALITTESASVVIGCAMKVHRMKLTGLRKGLLLNFNEALLKHGIKSVVL
jgi:hypothetical protein